VSAGLAADAILAAHVAIAAFVVLGALAIVAGGLARADFVRNRRFRVAHLVLVAFIALQAWLGRLCPLTTLEQHLRERAGEAAYRESFVAHWLARLLYVEAPWWAFVAGYTMFLALVAASWFWWPPRTRRRR